MQRRDYIAIAGGLCIPTALAGCTGNGDTASDEEANNDNTNTEAVAEFEIVTVLTDGESFGPTDAVEYSVSVENTGTEPGEGAVAFEIAEETVELGVASLDPGEKTTMTMTFDYTEFTPGTWEGVARTDDDEVPFEFTIEEETGEDETTASFAYDLDETPGVDISDDFGEQRTSEQADDGEGYLEIQLTAGEPLNATDLAIHGSSLSGGDLVNGDTNFDDEHEITAEEPIEVWIATDDHIEVVWKENGQSGVLSNYVGPDI